MDQREQECFETLRRASRRQMAAAAAGLLLRLAYLAVLAGLVMPQVAGVPYSRHLQAFGFIFSTCGYAELLYTAWQTDSQVADLARRHGDWDARLEALPAKVEGWQKSNRTVLWLAGAMSAILLVVELAAAGSAYSLLLLLIHGGMMALWRHASAQFGRVLDGLLPEHTDR